MLRRVSSILLVLLFCLQAVALAVPSVPAISAEASVLIDAKTGKVLFGKEQHKVMYPASTTKMMTLLLALEKGNLSSTVIVSPRAARCEESSLGLQAGDQLSLRQMVTGMMVVSGNDAAEAVAEHVGGSIEGFAAMMNEKAQQLGLENTHFSNPHGLPDPVNHYSTAMDLATIAAYGLKNPDFARIVSLREYDFTFNNRPGVHHVVTTNRFLKTFPGATGVKTGYTEAAGDCLVASAKRGNVELIAVLLNDDERWEDAANLMEYGFKVMAEADTDQ
ncbi:MAG: Serine-type D-Ala-D-Ala carboxypeptidase [Firmicutes bacterium]|nr:Serine-type D-Ala-D-Ala carboxypeptidase [Bacillota bacterium]